MPLFACTVIAPGSTFTMQKVVWARPTMLQLFRDIPTPAYSACPLSIRGRYRGSSCSHGYVVPSQAQAGGPRYAFTSDTSSKIDGGTCTPLTRKCSKILGITPELLNRPCTFPASLTPVRSNRNTS